MRFSGWLLVFTLVVPIASNSWDGTESTKRSASDFMSESARLYAAKNLDGAIKTLKHALRVYPDDAQLHFMLANAYFRKEIWQPSIVHYQKATHLRPDHTDTYLNLGYALHRVEKVEESLDAWDIAVEQTPQDAFAHLSISIGYLAVNDLDKVRHHLRQAIDLAPDWRQRLLIDIRWTATMLQEIQAIAQTLSYPDH